MKIFGLEYKSQALLLLFFWVYLLPIHAEDTLNPMGLRLDQIGISNPDDTINHGGLSFDEATRKVEKDQEAIRQAVRNQFCDQEPVDQICSEIPHDNLDFSSQFVYIFLTQSAQNSFDVFSWQSFIGLNWLGDVEGEVGLQRAPWMDFDTPQELFDVDPDPICDSKNTNKFVPRGGFLQTAGRPLIDRNLNYVVYDVRVNSTMADYLRSTGLTTFAGQIDYSNSGNPIEFPAGFYQNNETRAGGDVGSIAVKTAWKFLDVKSGDNPSRYYTVDGLVPVSAEQSEDGEAFCVSAQLGLVGMHIMRKTRSGNGDSWIWSTFEHIDNAPLATNYRRPNAVLSETLFEDGCESPAAVDQRYAFYDESCPDCETNSIGLADWKWSRSKPHAAQYSTSNVGTQVVRCWEIFEGTQLINAEWQKKLAGSVWSNYQSLSAQWKGANRGAMVPEGEVPRFLTNTTMETYEQYSHKGSCLSCHAAASTVANQSTGFSFIPGLLARYR